MTPTTPTPSLLIVEDEPDLRSLYELSLLRLGYKVISVGDLASARQQLAERTFDVVVTDMRLPDGLGLELIRELSAAQRPEKTMVITAYGSAENAVEALKAGAFDYLTKPVELPQFRAAVASALRNAAVVPVVTAPAQASADLRAHQAPDAQAALDQIVGPSAAMVEVRHKIQRVAPSMAPVLVLGESDTGKELVARALHACSHRADGPFVAVNCSAIPDTLIEAEFFGVRKGAYTGATADREGYFKAAEGGTLFLDEIGDLPLAMQAKLLRAIQERRVRPLGGTQEENTDVRIVSATHRDLAQAVSEGRFRQDLYYRLNVIELRIPPLRARPEDLADLSQVILKRVAARNGEAQAPTLTREAIEHLQSYAFPGNVRELENILERASALHPGTRLGPEQLDMPNPAPSPAESALAGLPGNDGTSAESPAPLERNELERLLNKNRWNQSRTARELGWTLAKLRYWMQRMGLGDTAS